jgi:hypothetical protein
MYIFSPCLYLSGFLQDGFLGIESYNGKRSAAFHLFRLHNKVGFDNNFKLSLNMYYKGFYRTLRQGRSIPSRGRRPREQRGNQDDGNEEEDLFSAWNADEAKHPMSVELLKALLGWLLHWNTIDGVFAHCYLLLTWNLCCRVESTALIKMEDISWSSAFDAFSVKFAHTKTDQLGEHAKHERHIYANPSYPLVCPLLSLTFYFTCCFNAQNLPRDCFLFPGPAQQGRFSKILQKILKRNEAAVQALGFQLKDIGTHSIRKGASTYLTSLVGGPPAAAIMVWEGWSMGNVKDRYFKYADMGDQYVGQCLTLTPVLLDTLASSPPYFCVEHNSDLDVWVCKACDSQFHALNRIPGFSRMVWMCLASLIYHQRWIERTFYVNHVIRLCASVLRSNEASKRLAMGNFIQVTFPWNDREHVYTGVPPHCVLLQQLSRISSSQQNLLDIFVDNVVTGLNRAGVTGEQMSADRNKNETD